MTRPDLSDAAKVAQYRAELRAVGRNQRLGGFGLVIRLLEKIIGREPDHHQPLVLVGLVQPLEALELGAVAIHARLA